MTERAVIPEQYCYFFDDDAFVEDGRPGFRRRIIVGERLELWFWRINGGAGGSVLHHHPEHEQIGIIMRGALDFRIGDPDPAPVTLHAGDVYLAPSSGTATASSSATTSSTRSGSSTSSPHPARSTA